MHYTDLISKITPEQVIESMQSYLSKFDVFGSFDLNGIIAVSELFYELIHPFQDMGDENIEGTEADLSDRPDLIGRPRGNINRSSIAELATWIGNEVQEVRTVKVDLASFIGIAGKTSGYKNAQKRFRKHLNRVYLNPEIELPYIMNDLLQIRGMSVLEELRDWISVYGTQNQQKTLEDRIYGPIQDYNKLVGDFCFNDGPWPKYFFDADRLSRLLKLLSISIRYPDPDKAINETIPDLPEPVSKRTVGRQRLVDTAKFVLDNASDIRIQVDSSGKKPTVDNWVSAIRRLMREKGANHGDIPSSATIKTAIRLPKNVTKTNGTWAADWG